jgi:hypothetical protein
MQQQEPLGRSSGEKRVGEEPAAVAAAAVIAVVIAAAAIAIAAVGGGGGGVETRRAKAAVGKGGVSTVGDSGHAEMGVVAVVKVLTKMGRS